VLVGFGYGASHSVIPTIIADCFGTENFGKFFGVNCLSVGIAGSVGAVLAGYVMDRMGAYTLAYFVGASCLALASLMAHLIWRERTKRQAAEAASD